MSIFSFNGHALAVPDAPESGEPGAWTRDEFVEMNALAFRRSSIF